jgi:5-formyltetrahydrofolate cyclo-ligase
MWGRPFFIFPGIAVNHKDLLRQQALTRRRGLSVAERANASASIMQRLLTLLSQKSPNAPLLVYRAFDDEVDTASLFGVCPGLGGRDVYAPVTHQAGHMQWRRTGPDTHWRHGSFGILEPAGGTLWSPGQPAVLACPLVGFDRSGNRLGLGKGCFDRWLGQQNGQILRTIGLAFACQECPNIPVEEHDVPLDVIITENEVIACRSC